MSAPAADPRAPHPPAPRGPLPGRRAAAVPGVAARPACALLAAYLTLTAVPLAAAAASAGGPARQALPTHLALLVLAWWGARTAGRDPGLDGRRGLARGLPAWLAAWLPLLAVPLLYAALPAVAGAIAGATAGTAADGLAPMHDARVIAWERALFGGASPAVALAARWPVRPLSELLHLAYLSYYVVIYGPPLVLWCARGHDQRATDAFATSAFTVLLAFVACYAVFLTFPVQGPWYTWPLPHAVPDGPVRGAVQRLLTAGASRGTAFPSSHVAVSVAQTLALGRVAPRLAAPAAVASVLLAVGTMYGGFHYGVDVVAGVGVGCVVGAGGPLLWRRMVRDPVPAAVERDA